MKLRNDLGTSDGTLVDRFLSKVTQMDDLLEIERDILHHHIFYKPFFTSSKKIAEISRQLMHEFLTSMVWPSLEMISYAKPEIRSVKFYPERSESYASNRNELFILNGGFCSNVEQLDEKASFSFFVCFHEPGRCALRCSLYLTGMGNFCTSCKKSSWGEKIYFSLSRSLMTTAAVTKVLSVLPLRETTNPLLFAIVTDKCVEIVQASHPSYSKLSEGNAMVLEKLPALKADQSLLVVFASPNVGCLVWNGTTKAIECTMDEISFQEIKLETKPEIFAFSNDLKLGAFVDSLGESITITKNSTKTVLTTANHGLPKIDALNLTKDKNGALLLIWNLKKQVCVVMRECIQGASSKWMVVQAFNPKLLNIPSNCDMETGWVSVHHTITHIFIFVYGSNIPWMWQMSTLINSIPSS